MRDHSGRVFGAALWRRAVVAALVVGVVLAIPTTLIANRWFSRMTPTRTLDYVFWVIASALLGLTIALRMSSRSSARPTDAFGGLGTFLAIGCPVCNRVVVGLLGVSGALNVFAPLQPLLGIASIVVIAFGVRAAMRGAKSCLIASSS